MASALADTPPFARFEWMLALRYLRSRRREGFISVISIFSFLGIMLGVATLIVVMAVMNGFRTELLDKILGFSGHATIVAKDRGGIANYAELTDRLLKLDGVVSAIPFIEGQALASSIYNNTGVLVRGVREADLKRIRGLNNDDLATAIREPGTPDEKASLDGFDKAGGIAVGRGLADHHLLGLGSTLTLVAPEGPDTVLGNTPRMRDFTVVSIFEIGMSIYDDGLVYMPFGDAQEYFSSEGGASAIEINVAHPERIADMLPRIAGVVGPELVITTWQQRNQTFFTALAVERNVMFLILTLIILVAAFNVISGLIMLVKDKSHDIAILRTMGASRGAIQRVFFMTGAAIGLAGTLAGLLIGVLFAANIAHIQHWVEEATGTRVFPRELYYLTSLPADLDSSQTAWVVAMALILSFSATLYPSWRAARLDPVEALRYE
ncbi:MAG: lipoprotein-releasing ABC transporter permease subunit [Hyphomicrobiales bacterium]